MGRLSTVLIYKRSKLDKTVMHYFCTDVTCRVSTTFDFCTDVTCRVSTTFDKKKPSRYDWVFDVLTEPLSCEQKC